MEKEMKKYLVAFAILSATLFAVSAANAKVVASQLVLGAKLMFSKDVVVPADGLYVTEPEWCEELSGVRGKGVVSVRLNDLSKTEGKASVLKAGAFYELIQSTDMTLDWKFQNMADSSDLIMISAIPVKGDCVLPYESTVKGLLKLGIRVRNSAH